MNLPSISTRPLFDSAGFGGLDCSEDLHALQRRPLRAPDHRQENETLLGLAQAMADSPGTIMQAVVDAVLRTLRADSAGICLASIGEAGKRSRWAALAGQWQRDADCPLSPSSALCADALGHNDDVLLKDPGQRYPDLATIEPRIQECLVVPLRVQGEAVGSIWAIAHAADRRFDSEDLRQLGSIARFAASTQELQSDMGAKGTLAAIVESSDDAILSKDLNSIIKTWNTGAEKVFGYTADEAIGRPVTMLIPAELFDEEPDILGRIRRGERIEHYETVRERKDGTRIDVSITVSPLYDARGRVVGASKIARDISARKRTDEALRQSQERLRRLADDLSEAHRCKDEFLAMLAHELRNPLAPLASAIQIARMTGGRGAAFNEALGTLDRQCGQLVRLTDDLLDVSRISRGTTELRRDRIELPSVVDHAVESVRVLTEASNQELVVRMPAEPVYLHADPARLAQALGNLLNNASKYTPPGGRIVLSAIRAGSDVLICVQDSGIGIDADQLQRVFDLFVQVDTSLERKQRGLGIGLTVVKSLIEMHGGTVQANSAGIGRGSEFTVRLPIGEEPDMPQSQAPADERPLPSGRRVLIVDDNRDAAMSLAMLLQLSGNETETAYDGLAAIDAATRFQPDIVLLDIGLPQLNGYEVARRIRSEPWGKAVKLVALTGWGQAEDRQRSEDAGFDAHLVKPVDHAALEQLLADDTRSAGWRARS